MIRISAVGLFLAATIFTLSSPAMAAPEEKAGVKEKKVEPAAGLLSASKRGDRTTVVETSWSSEAGESGSSAPIAGSVSKVGAREWKMHVANNTEDPYSVDLSVQQIGKNGSVVKTDHFSYRLSAGQKIERLIPAALSSTDARLVLGKWKNLAPPEKEKEETAAGKSATPAAAKR